MRFNRKTNQTILIDGGLGSTLLDYGVNVNSDPLWSIITSSIDDRKKKKLFFVDFRSGKSLVEQPDKLVAVHRA